MGYSKKINRNYLQLEDLGIFSGQAILKSVQTVDFSFKVVVRVVNCKLLSWGHKSRVPLSR